MVAPKIFNSQYEYTNRYCDGHPTPYGYDAKGSSNLNELNLLLLQTVMIRRKKSEVLNQLPPKTRIKIPVKIQEKHLKTLKKAFRDLKTQQRNKNSKNKRKAKDASSQVLTIIQELFQSSGTSKIPAIMEYLEEQVKSVEDPKILLFAYHSDMVEACCLRLEQCGVRYIKIDGKTNQKIRQDLVDQFQNSPDCKVAVLSILAAGTGLTFTAAKKVIFAELYWNPGCLLQCEDRAHRIGQKNPITVEYLIGDSTLDEHVWDIVESKLDILGQTLDGQQSKMDAEDSMDEVCSTDFDPNSALYGSYIQRILDRIDSYDDRMEQAKERRMEREQQQLRQMMAMNGNYSSTSTMNPPSVVTQTPSNRIIVDLDDEYFSSQQSLSQSLNSSFCHVGEKRPFEPSLDDLTENQRIISTPAGNGAALLANFAYQPPLKKKKFVD